VKKFIIYLGCVLFLFTACKSKSSSERIENIEIYSTKGTDKSVSQDSMQYFESTKYDGEVKQAIAYYDKDGKLKGTEKFIYAETDKLPIGSNYVDDKGATLSYYKFVNDAKGHKIASYAFDASNDELLRVERFYYDLKGNVIRKSIHTASYGKTRSYVFNYDADGNETGMKILSASDSLLINDEYTIAKKDTKNKWTERWGLVNGVPKTMHKRTTSK
jgi:hypothetical protein